MKYHNALVDDAGQKWHFLYEEKLAYEERDGEFVPLPSTIINLQYRKEGSDEWLTLPPWADVAEKWKMNLCLFDEDEDTGEITYWKIIPAENTGD